MGLRDEILREKEAQENAMKDAMTRNQNEMKRNYQTQIEQASADITDCIFNAFRTAHVSDSYQVPGIFFNKTVQRKNIAIQMSLKVKFHEQFQKPIIFKAEYYTDTDDYTEYTYFSGYTLYADAYSYPLIMNAVMDKLEEEGIARCSVKETGYGFQDGFCYIARINEFWSQWGRMNPEFERRYIKGDEKWSVTLPMILFLS